MRLVETLKLSIVLFTVIPALGQGVMTYEGPFESGEAVYEYTENATHQKVFNGSFTYTETRHMEARGGDQEILITGQFKEDKKHLAWAVTIKPVEGNAGRAETIIGNYLNGEKSGLWTHRLFDNQSNEEIKSVKASFIQNHFRGPFNYVYHDSTAQQLKDLTIKGSFNNDGKLNGTWLIKYTDPNGVHFTDSIIYLNGVEGFRKLTSHADGAVLESKDQLSLVTSFFSNMDKLDSSATVGGEKYGLRHTSTEHKILKPVFTTWMNLAANTVGDSYDSPLPTVLFKKGEVRNPKLLANKMELIPWKETPKGKREYEARMAVQRQYQTKIDVADLQFKERNLLQALKLYKEAYAIKDEVYAKDKIAEVEEMIRVEAEKKRILTLINSREELWKGNNNMLEAETYYGKKDKLFEASQVALDHLKKELYSDYRETRTKISQETAERLSLESLEEYKQAIDEVIAFQERIKVISKREDTKDLEKELKKMEDPKAIVDRIKKG